MLQQLPTTNVATIQRALDLYQQESARLASSYAQATGLPVVAIVVAVLCGALLLWAQLWLAGRTHRMLNRGLVAASLAACRSSSLTNSAWFRRV